MKCSVCGRKATIKATDPYAEEFKEENEKLEEEWCEECYEGRSYEI